MAPLAGGDVGADDLFLQATSTPLLQLQHIAASREEKLQLVLRAVTIPIAKMKHKIFRVCAASFDPGGERPVRVIEIVVGGGQGAPQSRPAGSVLCEHQGLR